MSRFGADDTNIEDGEDVSVLILWHFPFAFF
jgi:hypothetical protein